MKVHNPNNLPTIPIADLLPTQGNLKHLTEKNYQKLKSRIEHRGFSVPVYVWEDDKGVKHLLDGHQRRQILITEGWNDPIPYLKIPAKDLQEAMARLLEITSQYATITQEGIDEFIATYELNEAEVYEATSFDALTSYGETEEPEVEEDEAPEVDESEPPKSKLGEIYQLGRHRVMCGDSTVKENVELLMNGVKADMVFTDPPYNVAEDSENYAASASKAHGKLQGSDWDYGFQPSDVMEGIKENVAKDCFIYMFTSHRLFGEIVNLFEEYFGKSSFIVWCKPNPMPSLAKTTWTFATELAVTARVGRPVFNYPSGEHCLNWLEIAKKSDGSHPTQKPIELCSKVISLSSSAKAKILDLFLGSGSTLIACEQTDRTCYGMELDPKYVDVIRKRYAKFINNGELPDNWEELTPAINSVEKA